MHLIKQNTDMKKVTYLLFFIALLMLSVVGVMGQATPTPESFIVGTDKKLIYGLSSSGTNTTPVIKDNGVGTLTYLTDGDKRVGFSHSSADSYKAVDFSAWITRAYKYLYYVYKGSVKADNNWNGFDNWGTSKDYAITDDGWRLRIVDISTVAESYKLQFYSEASPTSYTVANIWESDYLWAPLTPTKPMADPAYSSFKVISFYGDTYGGGSPERTDWGGDGTSKCVEETIGSHKFVNIVNTTGAIKTATGTQTDVSGMQYLNLDVFSQIPDTKIQLAFNNSGTGAYSNWVIAPATVAGDWQRVSIPIADFKMAAGFNPDRIFIKTDWSFYLDNIFLYNAVTTDIPSAAPDSPADRNACARFSIYNDSPYGSNGTWGDNTLEASLGGNKVRKISWTIGDNTYDQHAAVNFGGSQDIWYDNLNFDLWLPQTIDADQIEIQLRKDATNSAEWDAYYSYFLPATNSGGWTTVSIPVGSFAKKTPNADVALSEIAALSFTLTGGSTKVGLSRTIFVDNIYFYSNEEPATAASAPVMASDKVISVYSDTYTSVSTAQPGVNYPINGNNTQKLTLGATASSFTIHPGSNLNIAGVGTANRLSLDIWLPPCADDNVKVDVGSTVYTIPTGTLARGSWTTVIIPTENLGISRTPSVTQLNFAGTTGTVIYVDNIYFYHVTANGSDVVKVVWPGNASLDYQPFRSISAAVDAIIQAGPTSDDDIEIAITAALTYEPEQIVIPENAAWGSLTIYPTVAKTVIKDAMPEENLALFLLESGAKNVTINGGLNNDSIPVAGDYATSGNLTIEGLYSSANSGSTIFYGSDISHVTVKNCIFGSVSGDMFARPEFVFVGSGNDITLSGNHFVNCMYLGERDATYSSAATIAILNDEGVSNYDWVISNNHFYETEPVFFKSPIIRTYINVLAGAAANTSGKNENPIQILDNTFGGTGRDENNRIVGTMSIGCSPDEKQTEGIYADATSSIFSVIEYQENWPEGSHYSLIQGNEIAQIKIKNPTTGIYESGESNLTADLLASFSGISTEDGLVKVEGNTVRDIDLLSPQLDTPSDTPSDTRYLMIGIRSNITGGKSSFDINENEVYGLQGTLYASGVQSIISAGIFGQVGNSTAEYEPPQGTIRNNRVIMGYEGTAAIEETGSSISAITATLQKTESAAQLDIYGNIVTWNKYSDAGNGFLTVGMIALTNSAAKTEGVINCYNNISYLQDATGFSDTPKNVQAWFAGISSMHFDKSGAESGTTNLFHNTVYLKPVPKLNVANEAGSGTTPYAPVSLALFFDSNKGNVKIWNNNFINENANGMAVFVFTDNKPNSIEMDYNNYYFESTGNFYVDRFSPTAKIPTFDEWKFSNGFSYLGRTSEHDHHSRFLKPDFADEAVLSELNLTTLETLKTRLAPKRFLGGRYTNAAGLADANKDFNASPRSEHLPTMGAINTTFSDYTSAGTISSLSNTYQDLVVSPDATGTISLGGDLTVHDIYNNTRAVIDIAGNTLTVTGYIGIEYNKNTVDASAKGSTIVYKGTGNGSTTGVTNDGATAQHIFENTFANNRVNNLVLDNPSKYFVLLHGKRPWAAVNEEPTEPTLDILNDFVVMNANETEEVYIDGDKGWHTGGLNCVWYKTHLKFSGKNEESNTPDLSKPSAYDSNDKPAYRPYDGQRISRHAIYNDSLYNLTSESAKLITYHDSLFVKNNLTIEAGGNFEIAADKLVQVEGLTKNNAGYAGLVIKSRELDDKETAANYNEYLFRVLPRPNATFIFANGKGSVAAEEVPATVEMHAKAKWDDMNYQWQYFTVPVKETEKTYATAFENVWIRRWAADPVNRNPWFGTPYWIYLESNQKLTSESGYNYHSAEKDKDGKGYGDDYNPKDNVCSNSLQGYELTQNEAKVHRITGNLTNNDYTLPMEYYEYDKEQPYYILDGEKTWSWDPADTKEPESGSNGWYVVGNPYTAAIKISELKFSGLAEGTVNIYHAGSYQDWRDGDDGSSAGGYVAIPTEQAGQAGLPDQIPSMQGFSIERTKGGDASFTVNYNAVTQTIGKNKDLLRAAKSENTASTIVELTSENYADRLWLFINPATTKGFNNGWDGKKVMNAGINLFTMEEEDTKFQVSTMDDIDGLYLGIKPHAKDTDYTLTFRHKGMNEEYAKLYLIDLENENNTVEDKKIDITADGSQYRFTASNPSAISKRFFIATEYGESSDKNDVLLEESKLSIHCDGKTIYLNNQLSASGTLLLYDIAGKLLLNESFEQNKVHVINTPLTSGVYLIRAQAGNNSAECKMVIQ